VRFLPFVLVAAGLHFLIPVVARIAPHQEALRVAHSSKEGRLEIDIEDVLLEPPRPDEPRQDKPTEVASNDLRPRLLDVVEPRVGEPNTAPSVEIPQVIEAAPTATGTPSAGPEEWSAPPPTAGSGPGVIPGIGSPVWAVPGVVPEATTARPAPTTVGPPPEVDRKIATKVITDLVREKDHGLGLDLPGAGAIATVVSDVVRGSGTPDVARATLEVKIAPGGRVASVRVVRSNAGASGDWSAVAASVNGRLAGKQFSLPEAYAAGAIVMVEVVSQQQLPDGSTGGTTFSKGGPSGGSLGGGTTFDVSNIGARPKRHVRSLILSARPAT